MAIRKRAIPSRGDPSVSPLKQALRGNPRDAGKLEGWDAYELSGRDERPPPFAREWVDTTAIAND